MEKIDSEIYKVYDGNGAITNPKGSQSKYPQFEAYRELFRIHDRQQAVNRYQWLIKGNVTFNSHDIERLLYYRGNAGFFFIEDKWYILPYSLWTENGSYTLDNSGKYNWVRPLTFQGTQVVDRGKSTLKDGIILQNLKYKVLKYAEQPDEEDNGDGYAVLIRDYSNGLPQQIVPRSRLHEQFFEDLAEINCLIVKNLRNSVARYTIIVKDDVVAKELKDQLRRDEIDFVRDDFNILTIKEVQEIQELKGVQALQTQEYWEAFSSLDNLRETMLGLKNSGVFNKKQHMLQAEADVQTGSADLAFMDGLFERKFACQLLSRLGLEIDVVGHDQLLEMAGITQKEDTTPDKVKDQEEQVSDNNENV